MTQGITETIGVDLGDKYSAYCVLDHASGEEVDSGWLRTTPSVFEKFFATKPHSPDGDGGRGPLALGKPDRGVVVSRDLRGHRRRGSLDKAGLLMEEGTLRPPRVVRRGSCVNPLRTARERRSRNLDLYRYVELLLYA